MSNYLTEPWPNIRPMTMPKQDDQRTRVGVFNSLIIIGLIGLSIMLAIKIIKATEPQDA